MRLPVRVVGKRRRRSLLKKERSGGRQAAKMPTPTSLTDQRERLTDSQSGSVEVARMWSWVSFAMEQPVPLRDLSVVEREGGWGRDVQKAEEEDAAESPLGGFGELDGGEIDEGGGRVDYVCDDVGYGLLVAGDGVDDGGPAGTLLHLVPAEGDWSAATEEGDGREGEVADHDHGDTTPDDDSVFFRKVEDEEIR